MTMHVTNNNIKGEIIHRCHLSTYFAKGTYAGESFSNATYHENDSNTNSI